MSATTLEQLRAAMAELTDLHEWAELQTARNMTLALMGRVGAVATLLQFAPDTLDPSAVTPELRGELADCLVYLVNLSDALGVDVLDEAVQRLTAAVTQSRTSATG